MHGVRYSTMSAYVSVSRRGEVCQEAWSQSLWLRIPSPDPGGRADVKRVLPKLENGRGCISRHHRPALRGCLTCSNVQRLPGKSNPVLQRPGMRTQKGQKTREGIDDHDGWPPIMGPGPSARHISHSFWEGLPALGTGARCQTLFRFAVAHP